MAVWAGLTVLAAHWRGGLAGVGTVTLPVLVPILW